MSFWDDLKNAGNTVADGTVDVGNKIADGVTDAANTVGDGVTSGANSFVGGVESTGKTAWEATSDESRALGQGIESAGLKINDAFIAGAAATKKGIDEGVEQIKEGAKELEQFVEQHACDIFIGSALSAAFVALAADGQEEASVGSIAALAAENFADRVALNFAAGELAKIIATPVYEIPVVSNSSLTKSELEAAIAFMIVKACLENPKLAIGSGGQFIAGVLIYGITHLTCEGSVPGGYQVWKGANASLFGDGRPSAAVTGAAVLTAHGKAQLPTANVRYHAQPSGIAGARKLLSCAADGSSVQLWTEDDNSGRQKWTFAEISNGTYEIHVGSGVENGKTFLSCDAEGNVNLWSQNDKSGRQEWKLIPLENGTFNIKVGGGTNKGETYLSSNSDGSIVDLFWQDDNSGRQQWQLIPA